MASRCRPTCALGCGFVFADGDFASRLLEWTRTLLRTTLHIVRKLADQRGLLAVRPRWWAVAGTFAWLAAHRRLDLSGMTACRCGEWLWKLEPVRVVNFL